MLSKSKGWLVPVLLATGVATALRYAEWSLEIVVPSQEEPVIAGAAAEPVPAPVFPVLNETVELPALSEQKTDAPDVASDSVADAVVAIDVDATPDEQGEEINPARRELEYLREALPGNLVVPAEKTAAEVDALFAEFEEYQALAQRVEEGAASAGERARYTDIRMIKFREEIALIDMCRDLAARQESAPLCANMAEHSEERLADIEKSMQALAQGL